MEAPVYSLKNEEVGKIEVPEEIAGAKWRPLLVRQVLLAQMANARHPWAHAKDRSEVRGGGRKPWRQKGTGRARHGSIRSPIWRGGGKAHGPTKERDYSQKVNKKMNKAAILSILGKKMKESGVKFFDTFALKGHKTKELARDLRPILDLKKNSKKFDILFVPEQGQRNIYLAARNLEKVKISSPNSLNVYDLMNYRHVFVAKDAIPEIVKTYSTKK